MLGTGYSLPRGFQLQTSPPVSTLSQGSEDAGAATSLSSPSGYAKQLRTSRDQSSAHLSILVNERLSEPGFPHQDSSLSPEPLRRLGGFARHAAAGPVRGSPPRSEGHVFPGSGPEPASSAETVRKHQPPCFIFLSVECGLVLGADGGFLLLT